MKSLANVANLADVTRRLSGAFASFLLWEGEGVKSLGKVANLADVTRRLSATCSRTTDLTRSQREERRAVLPCSLLIN